jgi:hypothetical protein
VTPAEEGSRCGEGVTSSDVAGGVNGLQTSVSRWERKGRCPVREGKSRRLSSASFLSDGGGHRNNSVVAVADQATAAACWRKEKGKLGHWVMWAV